MQVVNVDKFGRLSGLVHKTGGVNLTKMGGKQQVNRASDIQWIPEVSLWAIKILIGNDMGEMLTEQLYQKASAGRPNLADKTTKQGVLLFDDYDSAVLCEVEYFQGLDLKRQVK